MELEYALGGDSARRSTGFEAERPISEMTRDAFIGKLAFGAGKLQLPKALIMLTDYVSASSYLLIRHELVQNQGLGSVVTSDWPYDLVQQVDTQQAITQSLKSEAERCLSLLQPEFFLLPDLAVEPKGVSRQYCSISFNVGRMRYSLLFLCPNDMALSPERLREVGMLASYCVSLSEFKAQRSERDFDLTEREVECLFWIAEGKTSDEIATILGISRNTINNYITSVMRKTATKTRSEAIAYAVRNNLV